MSLLLRPGAKADAGGPSLCDESCSSPACLFVWIAAAHKLYAVRLRLVYSVSGEVKWVTVAYVPVVRTLKEPAGKERARHRRAAVLQRVLYLVLRSTIAASHVGVSIWDRRNKRNVVAFPRLLAYLAD